MTYLVTGGSGFIGSHLIEALLKTGHSVINIDNFDNFYSHETKIQNTLESVGKEKAFEFTSKDIDIERLQQLVNKENYRLYYSDIRDRESLQQVFSAHKIDMVIHLAALAGVRPSIEKPLEYEEVNIIGSMLLWEACRDFGIKKFINASSSSVYGENEKIPFEETDFVDRPVSPYAATKKCTEIISHVYHHLYGLDMIHLRFFTVYGPRQRPDLAIHKFAKLIIQNQPVPYYGDGTTARDYTYIADIVDGILKSANYLQNHHNVFEILNLGENEVITLAEMLTTLEKALKTAAEKTVLPRQAGDVRKTNADITKARTLIGYAPQTNFQNGIEKFVEWFLRKAGEPGTACASANAKN